MGTGDLKWPLFVLVFWWYAVYRTKSWTYHGILCIVVVFRCFTKVVAMNILAPVCSVRKWGWSNIFYRWYSVYINYLEVKWPLWFWLNMPFCAFRCMYITFKCPQPLLPIFLAEIFLPCFGLTFKILQKSCLASAGTCILTKDMELL